MKTMEKKITKREMFNQIKAHLTDEKEIAFIEHEIELLNKKKTTESKKSIENAEIANKLFDCMETNRLYRTSEFINAVEEITSTSKATIILKLLVEQGKVKRTRDTKKGITYFERV